MDLSIIILHYGTPKDVTKNLAALNEAILPKETEVIVVNNGRSGANNEIEKPKGSKFVIKFFEIENEGYPQGCNFGALKSSGKNLAFLSPDIEINKETFKVLVDHISSHPKCGICAPRLRFPNGKIQDNFRVFPCPADLIIKRTFLRAFFAGRMHKYLMWNKDPQKTEQVDWLTGAFQVFTREAWDKVGPNDGRYFLFMSDVDICRMAWGCGFTVDFIGETEARHNETRLSAGGIMDLFRKKVVRIHILDAVKYYFKYFGACLPKDCPSMRSRL
ncbi:MAG: glycosyltransferase [Candidatus Gracilibacteria bacterium]|jgi:hypothetical protein